MRIKFNLLILSFVLALQVVKAQQKPSDFILIHNNSGVGSTITKAEIAKIFHGKYSRWPKTQKQVILVLPSSKHTQAPVIAKLMGFSSFKEMQKFWLSMVFQGRFGAPLFYDTNQEMVDYINRNSGSAAIISADMTGSIKKELYSLIIE